MKDEKKRKLEKLSDGFKQENRDLARAVDELRSLNAGIGNLTALLKESAGTNAEKFDAINKALEVLQAKESPTDISVRNFPEQVSVRMDRPDWYKDPADLPAELKASIDWENMPKQKDEAPSWIASALAALVTGIAQIFTKPIGARLERGAVDRAQFVFLLDPESGRALTKEDLRPLVNVEQRIPPSGGGSGGGSGSTDVTDRAARLLGIIYGDQGQLKQRTSTREAETYDTNLAAVLGTVSLIASGRVKTDGSGVTQPISAAALPLPTGAATEATLASRLSESDFDTKTGALTETAPASDTASSGLNGRLQRIAQRLTSLIAAVGSPFQAGGSIGNTTFGATQSGAWSVSITGTPDTNVTDRAARLLGIIYGNLAQIQQKATTFEALTWDKNLETVLGTVSLIASGRLKVDGSGVTQPISAAALPLPTGAATEATLATRLSESDFDTKIGSLTETAPATDTASSGLNGRLQRIAQRLTTINSTLGSPFQAGGSIGNTTFGATQSGAWTVGVNNFPSTYDVSDRAARLLGVIYGSQGAQLSQRATTFEANTYDTNLATVLGTASLINAGRVKVEASQLGSPWGVNPTAETAGVGVGAAADAEAAGNGSVIAILKRLRTILGGVLSVQQVKSGTATLSNVAGSATSVSLLASNANRLGAVFFNDSTANLYLKFGTTASTSSFTIKMAAGSYYELPTTAVYTGAIDGIWDAANGNARITELT